MGPSTSLPPALARYPLQAIFTAATLLAFLVTVLFYAGLLPVTRSLETFARLVSLTLVLAVFAAVFWAGPLAERLLG